MKNAKGGAVDARRIGGPETGRHEEWPEAVVQPLAVVIFDVSRVSRGGRAQQGARFEP
jgi:hypothetical protein